MSRHAVDSCKFPGRGYRCGKCLPCLVRKRGTITARGVMEAQYYPINRTQFVTLTYNEEFLPVVLVEDRHTGEKMPHETLRKRDLQAALRRMDYRYRKLHGKALRYLAAGEYGGQFGRPHYHLILFDLTQQEASEICYQAWSVPIGTPGLVSENTGKVKVKTPNTNRHGWHFEKVLAGETRHQMGFITIGEGNALSVAYTASYTLAGITDKALMPEGVEPEFALWSTRPGIGSQFMRDYGAHLAQNFQVAGLPSTYDDAKPVIGLPHSVDLPTPDGPKPFALDRTMRNHLLRGMGIDPDGDEAKEARSYAYETRQQAMMLPGDPLGIRKEATDLARKGFGRAGKMRRRHLEKRRSTHLETEGAKRRRLRPAHAPNQGRSKTAGEVTK